MKPWWENNSGVIYQGDCLAVLRALPAESVQTCVTSPPYWGLRDYGVEPIVWGDASCEHEWCEHIQPAANGIIHAGGMSGETLSESSATRKPKRSDFCVKCGAWRGAFGLEPTPELFVTHLVEIFREVRRVLRDDGTIWVNLGDSYGGGTSAHRPASINKTVGGWSSPANQISRNGFSAKNLVGMPWRVAFALQADGWILRSDIIWAKPNPMPESVTDRPTKAHEYLFLLSKRAKYFYDFEAMMEDAVSDHDSGNTFEGRQGGAAHLPMSGGNGGGEWKRKVRHPAGWKSGPGAHGSIHEDGREQEVTYNEIDGTKRNKRSVWTVATAPFPSAHFATFPPKLIEPCIKAGCPAGGVVLDPFNGAGTTSLVAQQQHCRFIGIELNPDYCQMAARRLEQEMLPF